MASKEARKAAFKKYRAKFDLIQVRVKQGEKYIIAEHARQHNESVNAFINRAIQETIKNDNLNESLCQDELSRADSQSE